MHTTETPRKSKRSPDSASNGAAPDGYALASARLRAEFDETIVALRRAFYVERQALGLSIFEFLLRAGVVAVLGLTSLALVIAAAFLALSAVRRGLAIATQGAWWSDLVLAFATIGLLAIAVAFVRRRVQRAALERTRLRLAKDEKAPAASEPVP